MKSLVIVLFTILSSNLSSQTVEELQTKILELEKENAILKVSRTDIINASKVHLKTSHDRLLNLLEIDLLEADKNVDILTMLSPYLTSSQVKIISKHDSKINQISYKYYDLTSKDIEAEETLTNLITKVEKE